MYVGVVSQGMFGAIGATTRVEDVSGDQRDALIRGGETVCGGPVIKDANDGASGVVYEPGWGMPELPPQGFWFCCLALPVKTHELEPADQICCERHDREACMVGLQVCEREPFQA